jgi:putative hydrolase of HD superfamily
MDENRFAKQIEFLVEIDKLKTVLRRTLLIDKSRRENDAEHSWHLAMMAMILREYAGSSDINMLRVLKMALVHDLIEIYAGDTFAYDAQGNMDKEAREKASADRLFSMLPDDQGLELRALWEEFDAMETPDSMFAAALDRLQPLIHNYHTEGHTWKIGPVTSDMVYKRMEPIRKGMPEVWSYVEHIIEDSINKGYLLR